MTEIKDLTDFEKEPEKELIQNAVNAPADEKPAFVPKARLAPKKGLHAMTLFVMDLRLRCRMQTIQNPDGTMRLRTFEDPLEDAARTFVELTPEDAETLEDIADVLDRIFIEKQSEKRSSRR